MQLLVSRRTCAVLASLAALFSLSSRCFADPVSLTASAVSTMLLGPSSDTVSLNAGSVTTDDSDSGTILFQTGDFILGNSAIPDQILPFSFQDSLTLNGVTEVLNIFGQDDVTSTADTLSLFAGAPVVFGSDVFTLQPFSATGDVIGEDLPMELQASITPTPEPSSLVLLGTGVLAAIVLATFSRRSLVQSASDIEVPIPFAARPTLGRSWVQRGAALQPAASDAARTPFQPASAPAPDAAAAGFSQSDARPAAASPAAARQTEVPEIEVPVTEVAET